jgi:nucleotide-binding universal stress UspA family protein
MASWKRICCPVDFSKVSRIALEEASDLALRFGATMVLLYVDDRPPLPEPDATLVSPEAVRMASLERDRQLQAWRDVAEELSTMRAEQALVEGDPAAEILRFAESGACDLIVMGTHGRTSRDHRRFGSVAQRVILDAPCPVLVVSSRGGRVAA